MPLIVSGEDVKPNKNPSLGASVATSMPGSVSGVSPGFTHQSGICCTHLQF